MLDTLKLLFFSVIVLMLLGFVGYWGISQLQSGSEFVANQKVQQLQQENDALTKQVADLTNQLNLIQSQVTVSAPVVQTPTPTTAVSATVSTQTTAYKNQSLIGALQQLITDNVTMKLKSTGTRVGVVQNFLNIYNNTSNKIDNSYGTSTEKAVADFQKAQGLAADGQAGPGTFAKMVSWLKKQG